MGNQGRPLTLFAQVQAEGVTIECIRKRIHPVGKRTDEEKDELLAAYEADWPIAIRLANTDAVLSSAFNGADGIYSRNFQRLMKWLERDNLVELFPTDPDPEPQDQQAA